MSGRRVLGLMLVLLGLELGAPLGARLVGPRAVTSAEAAPAPCKRKRRKKKKKEPEATPAAAPSAPEVAAPSAPEAPSPTSEAAPTADEAPAEGTATRAAPLVDGRRGSRVTPGSASRWSNRGAMTPIETEVPVTAPLPERAVPKAAGVATPGQGLTGDEDQLTARLSLGAYHVETVRQDFGVVNGQIVPVDRDIDLQRASASLRYARIAGSWFGAALDVEYRARSSGNRPTDRRIQALYVSWGLTDHRRDDQPSFGVALGRVSIPEAGHAQADGGAVRLRILPELHAGAFGGVSGNPYVYNWALRRTQDFSTDWWTAGAFGAYRDPRLFVNLAAVVYGTTKGAGGLDRVNAYLDAGLRATDTIDLFLTGWLDVLPDGRPLQNVELVGAWAPSDDLNLRLSLARFSTLQYAVSTPLSFAFDPTGARLDTVDPGTGQVSTSTAVDANGQPIRPFDAALQVASYDAIRLRGGYRFGRLEPFLTLDALIRHVGDAPPAEDFSALRLLPGAGVSFRDRRLFDATVRVLGIVDAQTDTDLVAQASISRAWMGLMATLDARVFLGEVFATDGGVDLAYTLPRAWFPGRFMLRAALRYYREDVELARPFEQVRLADDERLPVIPRQESFMGFAGVDWRL